MRDSTSISGRESALKTTNPEAGETPASLTKDIRWYKGKYHVEVLIKGKRKGQHGPITYLVKALDDIYIETLVFRNPTEKVWCRTIMKGEEFTTIPRLLWRRSREERKRSAIVGGVKCEW